MLYNQVTMSIQILDQLIRTRRAIRHYQDRPVAKSLIERLLEAAMWAPSAHNRQPWRFAVLTEETDKEQLAQAMGERLYQDRLADGDPPQAIERDLARSRARIVGAPVVIVIFISMADMDHYPDKRRQGAEQIMAVQSAAMAAQNLWLMAHAKGLGACWLCAPLFVPDLVRDVLDVPSDWQAQGLMTMGWPAEEKSKTRKSWQESAHFL